MTQFYYNVRKFGGPIVRLLFRFKCCDFNKIPDKGAAVVCCNHTSLTDIIMLVVGVKHRQLFFMAKKELFDNKIAGWFFTKMGGFPVNREGSDMGAIKKAQNIIKEGKLLCIFPEGTRSKDGKIHKGKAGAALVALGTKSPVIPISIYRKGRPGLFNRTTLRCGDAVPYERLKELKAAGGLQASIDAVMEKITAQWEMEH